MSNYEKVLTVAHRGASGDAPENTMAAFKLAAELGADAIELDVHLSADHELFCCHDFTVDRTSNGSGELFKLSSAELKRLDAGAKFAEKHGGKYAGESFPLLSEVFEELPKSKMIYLEVKMAQEYDGIMQKKLMDMLRKYDRVNNVLLISFHHPVLNDLLKLEPSLKVGLLYSTPLVQGYRYAENFVQRAASLNPSYKWLSEEDCRETLSHGLQVNPWTIDNPDDMRKLIDLGVTSITTNYPARMAELKRSGK
jgi:glycerophosphoryl diester phosphodiesterase